jgi:hypothetical protein
MKKIYLLLLLGIFLIGVVSSATFCCEKTTSKAWCQNVNEESKCDDDYRSVSTFCASTSYCQIGTCVNQKEGTCSRSTQVVCENNKGFWSNKLMEELPQCKAGCCFIGSSTAFVTEVTCNSFPSKYKVDVGDVSFDAKINDELSCLEKANPDVEGACVYTEGFVKKCTRTTKSECQTNAKNSALSEVEFHEDYLCSAQSLGTGCGISEETKCEGDDVYFIDTCGNLANIYDSSQADDEDYWTRIQEPTCGNQEGNKNSASCGDCDYHSGSKCQEKKTGDSVDKGDYLCRSLDCKDYRGPYTGSSTGIATSTKYPLHEESWCATDSETGFERTKDEKIEIVGTGNNRNPVGNTQVRLICYDEEVTQEICSTERQEICAESTYENTNFKVSACKKNVWEDCVGIGTKEDCEDVEKRDCSWITSYGYSFSSEGFKDTNSKGICVPKYSPGFNLIEEEEGVVDGESCTVASTTCAVVMVKKGLDNHWKCKEEETPIKFWGITWKEGFENNCDCIGGEGENDGGEEWAKDLNNICTQLGDCGIKTNYVGKLGYSFDPIKITTIE